MAAALIRAWLQYLFLSLRRPSSYPPHLQAIKDLYHRLRRATEYPLEIEVFGASRAETEWGQPQRTSLGQAVRRSASPPWKGYLLYRLVQAAQPTRILEIGTHVGIGSLYVAFAAPQAEFHTIEGSPTLAQYAKRHFRLFGIRPQMHIGSFKDILPTLSGPWDLVYLDGDHRSQALLRYAELLYPQLSPQGWLICDDIFWSKDMYRGWKKLAQWGWRDRECIGPFGLLRR